MNRRWEPGVRQNACIDMWTKERKKYIYPLFTIFHEKEDNISMCDA